MPDGQQASATRAVFVSYAREDTASAQRIAEALRGFGVEVWFDQSELRGGDAWDAKIREQVETCALFIPIISAATQARREGYFRLEWNLADDRTHLMAGGTPFLLPVVVDDTKERGALVPKSFLTVQWTRLPGGEPTGEFCARAQNLLGKPASAEEGRGRQTLPPAHSPATPAGFGEPALQSKPRMPSWVWAALAIFVVGIGVAFLLSRKPEPPAALPKPIAVETKLASPVVHEKSVAVLAFENLSGDKDNEYFADGISEELLNVLAKVPGLFVSARTSAFSFKGKNVPVPQIARELGVTYIIEGSVRKAGTSVRITAQLINAENGFHLWSETYTREPKDVFAVQDEIAQVVTQNLQLTLGMAKSVPPTPVNPEVYRFYFEGRQAWAVRTRESLAQAQRSYEQALAIDPKFAPAIAGEADLALIGTGITRFSQRNGPQYSHVIALAESALAIDPNVAEAYATIGQVRNRCWQFAEAEKAFRRAIALNPSYATAHHWFGLSLLEQGYMDQALAESKLAAELDPRSHQILSNYAATLSNAGRLEEGLIQIERALALSTSGNGNRTRVKLLVDSGRTDEAMALAEKLSAGRNAVPYAGTLAYAYSKAGRRADAEAAFNRIATDDGLSSTRLFRWFALAALGRHEEIIATLNSADLQTYDLESLLFQPDFDPIRKDPRFLKIFAELGVTEAYERAQAWRAKHPPTQAAKK